MRTRQEERYENTLNEIRQLAWELMAEQGPASLSLREISRRMRVSSAAIYRYFPSRNALLEDLSLQAYLDQAAALEAEMAALPSAELMERIRAMALAYRHWAVTNPVKYLLVYGSPVPGYWPDWTHLTATARRPLDGFIALVSAAEQSGLLQTDLPMMTAALDGRLQTLITERDYTLSPNGLRAALGGWALVHGLVSLELNGQFALLGDTVQYFFSAEIERYIISIRA